MSDRKMPVFYLISLTVDIGELLDVGLLCDAFANMCLFCSDLFSWLC